MIINEFTKIIHDDFLNINAGMKFSIFSFSLPAS